MYYITGAILDQFYSYFFFFFLRCSMFLVKPGSWMPSCAWCSKTAVTSTGTSLHLIETCVGTMRGKEPSQLFWYLLMQARAASFKEKAALL